MRRSDRRNTPRRSSTTTKRSPSKVPGFRARVLAVVARIPRGKTLTYKEVAVAAGSPRACRAVGNVLNGNHDPRVPCHRVVRSDGTTGGFNRGAAKKRRLLLDEGAI